MSPAASIEITQDIVLNENELQFEFVRASGPGGQNVNKVSSAVQLRYDVRNSPSLPEAVRERLLVLARSRVSEQGVLVIEARRFRTQEKNRQDALDRLVNLIRRAAEKPKIRKKTRPTEAAKRRRLEEKRHRGEIKRVRASKVDPAE
jgi:ribosome-associated protein